MYIVAIGWLWVVLMMAITETSVTAGFLTFFFYGLAPLALFLWLVGTPARRRRSADQAVDHEMRQKDGGDTGRNQ
jgi:biotin transporter BioY